MNGPLGSSETAALRWLEALQPPVIAAPVTGEGQRLGWLAPNNDLDAVQGDHREIAGLRRAKIIKPRLFDPSTPLLYIWTLTGDDASELAPVLPGQ